MPTFKFGAQGFDVISTSGHAVFFAYRAYCFQQFAR